MTDFRRVTDTFYVAPQISVSDVETAKNEGFSVLVMNRPDGETPDQPPINDIVTAAEGADLSFKHIPITAPPNQHDVQLTADMLAETAGKKVLAFCRSGTRSITLWAYAMAANGSLSVDEILSSAVTAGYDLSPHQPNLEMLAGE